jgi:hypothetical protein
MTIAPDSVSYPVLAVAQYHPELAPELYHFGWAIRKHIEEGWTRNQILDFWYDGSPFYRMAVNMIRSHNHFNPEKALS